MRFSLLFLTLFIPLGLFGQEYKILVAGDGGEISEHSEKNFGLLGVKAKKENVSAVVLLGDNIYPRGLPPKGHKDRSEAEQILAIQLEPLKDFHGKVYIIPGNHDWKAGHKGGYEYVRNLNSFIDSVYPNVEVIPGNGCPGPEVRVEKSGPVMVFLDTQWLLHPYDKPDETSDCQAKTGAQIWLGLEAIFKTYPDRQIIVFGHHPIFSDGKHGGRSHWKDHIFPLTDLASWAYLPLPIIGSVYPLYTKYLGHIQDLSHPRNKLVRKSLHSLMSKYPGAIYVSGHEHSLQFLEQDSIHYVISGSGSKTTYAKAGRQSEFAASAVGFTEFDLSNDGIEIKHFKSGTSGPELLFSKTYPYWLRENPLKGPRPKLSDSVNQNINNRYLTKPSNYKWMGKNYRREWATEVDFPVFDIAKEKGGLRVIKKGGGMQTLSLRLEAQDGRQYVLRSVNKDVTRALPDFLVGSFAADLVQDQISASHPYGAFAIPGLADAAGIYHTNPKPVFLPKDPLLGPFQNDLGGQIYLFEERPSGNWESSSFFGNSKKIVSTQKVLDKLEGDNDHEVDQAFVLRNRLFDLIIGDWDRHDDQWRWASFKGKHGKLYRPIPRDRDQAFFVNQGIIPRAASRRWAMPKFEGFNQEVRFVPGFMFNARYFDRSFLNELPSHVWDTVASGLETRLSDQAIENALTDWPYEINRLSGEEIVTKLKSRRDRIREYALEHYKFLARKVDIVGSNKNEKFLVTRNSDGSTDVLIRKISKEGKEKHKIYERKFFHKETKEIRLYGLGGKDEFELKGTGSKGSKIRIIAGPDDDKIVNDSRVKGVSRKTWVYDTRSTLNLQKNGDTRRELSNSPDVNEYNRKEFKYNTTVPLVYGAFNIDDGIYLGGGFLTTIHGFRSDPYKQRHLFHGLGAFKTGAFDFKYQGIFNHFYKKLDFKVDIDAEGPNYTRNFFGVGNNSEYDDSRSIRYYYVRFDNFIGSAMVRRRFGQSTSIALGPLFEDINVRQEENRFITDNSTPEQDSVLFERKQFGGLSLNFIIDTRNNELIPTKGIHFVLNAKSMQPISDLAFEYTRLQAEFSFYLSFRSPATVTLSNRTGGGISDGDIEFYQANTLGGTGKEANLRGYRRTRFYGQSSFYNNTDLRITLFGFKTYVFPAKVGMTLFYDVGRVWWEDLESTTLHHGYGAGLWITPFESVSFNFDVAYGESLLPSFRLGFLF